MAPTPDDAPELPREDDQPKREDEPDEPMDKADTKQKWESLFNKLRRLLRFAWQFLRSTLVSLTKWLNRVSRDYRYVAKHLSLEKKEVKANLNMQTGVPVDSGVTDIEAARTNISNYGVEDVEIRVERASEDMSDSNDDVQLDTTLTSGDPMDPEMDHNGNVVQHLLIAVWYALLSRSELVCYLMICANQMKSASMLSLPLPLMAFLWGSLSIPRPSRTFWITIIAYTEAIVLIKYMFQFSFFPWNQVERLNAPFWPPRILGVEKKPQYAVYDLALLLVLFFHRFMLKSLGLWTDTMKDEDAEEEIKVKEKSLEEVKEVLQEKSLNESVINKEESFYRNEESEPKLQAIIAEAYQGIRKYLSPVWEFFHLILHPSYHVTVDVYAYMFFCDFLNFLVVVFGFSSFGTQQGDGGVSAYLEENKVPVPFLVMLILQFGLIVIDRALYLRKFIVGKLIFQVVSVFGVHFWMFFILPAVTEREFTAAKPPQIWYMVKCVYLLLSAYQIRSGYPKRILGNYFCKKYNYLNMFFFKGFMLVPFLFELRALMDWIWTDTSMSLSDWLKMEDIFAHIFQLKCQRRAEAEYPLPRGAKRRPTVKYGMGGSALFIIIAIIWFPLVLFALGNTVGIANPPVDVSVKVSIGGYEPIFTMSAQQNALIHFNEKDWDVVNYHYRANRIAQTLLGNYDWQDVVVAKLNGNSSSVWTISPPSQKRLIDDLGSDDPLELRLTWEVTRKTAGPEIVAKVFSERLVDLEPGEETRVKLARIINRTSDDDRVMFSEVLPKFIKVSNRGGADYINQLAKQRKEDAFIDLILTLRFGTGDNALEHWWEVRENCKNSPYTWLPHSEDCQYLTMYTFNEKAFPSGLSIISGGGIIGMYTTLVLVASKLVRGFFAGISYTIMFDDLPNVDKILQLCLDIYLVRESKELSLEEDLFAKLIFLYRSPETLIKWSRSKDQPVEED